jgi:hypothetical protein
VEKLMGEVEMAAAHDLVAIDQHHIQFRQAACRAGNALKRIHHENKDAKLPFHDLDKAHCRYTAESELGHKTLSGLHGIFEALIARDPQGPAQQWR